MVETLVAALAELGPAGEPAPSNIQPAAERPAGHPCTTLAEPLTERELDVLRLIADGASNQDIARQLVVSLATGARALGLVTSG